MRIGEIKKMIRDAVADEQRSGRLSEVVGQTAQQRGLSPNGEAVHEIVRFAREYAEHVPLLLEQGESAAKQAGLSNEMGQVLQELESYWFRTDDLISDHLGLMGLLDDAYATLILLQAFSDYCQANYGRPLLQQNLTAANNGMRTIIGDQIASVLEQSVGVTLTNALMQRLLGQIVNTGFSFPQTPDPIWGNASIDDIVNTRLGAMGVV